tara:strand:- start:236 stop:607 length:372 start_codon:yes stop_codon:yes gene_type:complete
MIAETVIILVLLLVIIGLVYQFMFDVWLFVLLGASIFYALFLAIEIVTARKKKALLKTEVKLQPKKVSKTAMKAAPIDADIAKLKAFIQSNLKKGFKEKVIRNALHKQGWSKDKVNKAFKASK